MIVEDGHGGLEVREEVGEAKENRKRTIGD